MASDLLDLNLLRVFVNLYEERSVTKAGLRQGITQSAVSHALGKMREALGDQLFIRGAEGMYPTPRAVDLHHLFAATLRQIDEAVARPSFDPASSEFELILSTSDYMTGTLFPSLMSVMERTAPRMRLWLKPISDINIVEELDRGSLHLAIGVFGRVPARFVKSALLTDSNVWLMRRGHPAADGALRLEDLSRYAHVDILISRRGAAARGTADPSGLVDQSGLERNYVTSNPQHIEGLLAERGLTRRVGATVSHILAVPSLLAATDMIAYVPTRFARFAERSFDVVSLAPPFAMPPLAISTLSHRTMGSHPAVAWVTSLLKASADMEFGAASMDGSGQAAAST